MLACQMLIHAVFCDYACYSYACHPWDSERDAPDQVLKFECLIQRQQTAPCN